MREKADYLELRDTWFKLLEAMDLEEYNAKDMLSKDLTWKFHSHNEVFKKILEMSNWTLTEWNERNRS